MNESNGLVQSTTLFQNFPSNLGKSDCRSQLSKAYALSFQALQDDVTICMDDLQLLPSMVQGNAMVSLCVHAWAPRRSPSLCACMGTALLSLFVCMHGHCTGVYVCVHAWALQWCPSRAQSSLCVCMGTALVSLCVHAWASQWCLSVCMHGCCTSGSLCACMGVSHGSCCLSPIHTNSNSYPSLYTSIIRPMRQILRLHPSCCRALHQLKEHILSCIMLRPTCCCSVNHTNFR